MTPYAAEFVSGEDCELHKKIVRMISRLPDLDLGTTKTGKVIKPSCYMLCIAIARIFPELWVVTGQYGGQYQHAWLATPHRNIIDAYPLGVVGGEPLLVHADDALSPGEALYRRYELNDALLYEDYFSEDWFQRSVDVITTTLKTIREAQAASEIDTSEMVQGC